PDAFDTVSRETSVCSLMSITTTPGMTPPASLTDPRRPPWNDCAWMSRAATTPMSNTSATNQRERIHPPEGALAAGQPPCRRNAATHFEQKADFMDPFVSGARITLLSAGGSCRRTCGSCNRYSTRLRKQSKRRSEPPERDQVRPDTIRKECRRHTNERLE